MAPMEATAVTNDVECEAGAGSCEEIMSYNTETYDTILSRELGPAKAVTFTVRAPNDAHVGFFSRERSLDEVYEIVIGGWGDTQSVIRESNQGTNQVTVDTQGIVSADEDRPFWADAHEGLVRLGTGTVVGENVVMQWQDPDPHTAVYVGIMTGWGGEGVWNMCFDSGIADEPDETYVGCFEDSGERDIEFNMGRMEDSTVEKCEALCSEYPYYALQDRTECYCDNAAPEGSRLPESECSSLCTGSDEICGGSWRNSVYEHVTVIICSSNQERSLARCIGNCDSCLADPRQVAKLGVCMTSTVSGMSAVEVVTQTCGDTNLPGGGGGGRGGGGH